MDRTTLTDAELAFLRPSRTAVLATQDPGGRPRLVPICFVVAPELDARGRLVLHTPIDEKPKQSDDPRQLQRVQDLLILPRSRCSSTAGRRTGRSSPGCASTAAARSWSRSRAR